MTDQAQRTEWALQLFDGFVDMCVTPFMQTQLLASVETVRHAINAIAPPIANPVVGYAVFAQRPERNANTGFEHIAISAVFDELGQAQNAYDGRIKRAKRILAKHPKDRERLMVDGSLVRLDELRGYAICAVQQIST